MGKTEKKSELVGRENKNNIILFLGSVYFRKIIFCIANTTKTRNLFLVFFNYISLLFFIFFFFFQKT